MSLKKEDMALANRNPMRVICFGLTVVLFAGCAPPDVRKGDRHAKDGEWDKALTSYRDAAKKEPFSESVQERIDSAKRHAAEAHYAEGRQALGKDLLSDALREFRQAFGLDPSKPEYQASMNEALRLKEARDQLRTGEKLQQLGRVEDALAAYERAVELDPTLTQALAGITDITKQQRAAKAIGGSSEPITLRFQNAKLKEVFEVVARTAGVNVIFDKEVRDEPITIFIKDLPFDEALSLILNTNGLISQKVATDTILIMPLNKQKQAQYQDLLMRTFYLSNAKAKDAVNLVRTLLDSKKIYVDDKVNAIVVRDEPAKLQLAERLLLAIDHREPEVELDVEVLEINRTKSLKYGLNFAKQAGTGIVPPGGTGGISTNPTSFFYRQLTSIGPESYLFTLPASVLIDFFKQDSEAKTLASPKLRVMNNKSATISIGDKQPILLSTTNVLPGQAVTGAVPTTSTVTSIEFKDTGVKLTVEPSLNLTDEVTLKLKVEVTRLGDQVTLQASPEIKQFRFGTRMAETVLMLKDEETVVLAGLIQDEERITKSTVPLLGDIPLLGHLFTSTVKDQVTTEVVLTITPRVVRAMATPPVTQQAFWSGTETTYTTSQLFPPRALTISRNATQPSSASKTQASGVPPGLNDSSSPTPTTEIEATQKTPPSPPQKKPTVRSMGGFSLNPEDLTAGIGQEFRVDLLTSQMELITESAIIIAYNPQQLEFRRVLPGTASIASRNADGQVIVSMHQQKAGASGEGVLAMLFFQGKEKGDATLKLDTSLGGMPPSSSGPSIPRQAIVHLR